jgi:dTMP kinase
MGKLLTLEGLDGSGKQTQAGLLADALTKSGIACRRVSFPDYAQPSSVLVKMYLNGEFGTSPQAVNAYAASSFFAVDRFASYQKFWKDSYAAGELILADRYTTSNMVYQMPKLPRAEWDNFLQWLMDYEYKRLMLPKPDLTVFLDMPATASESLLEKRYSGDESKKDIHERNAGFQNDCREAALYTARKLGWVRVSCVEGSRLKTPQEIHEELLCAVRETGLLQTDKISNDLKGAF